MSIYNKIILRLTFILTIILGLFYLTYSLSAQEEEAQEGSGIEPQNFINDKGRPDYIDPLREIIDIGTQLGEQVNEGKIANYNNKYYVESLPNQESSEANSEGNSGKFGADIFSLSKRAGVNHIRNLRHIIFGYLQSRYNYNREDATSISASITNYNAVYRQNISYIEQRYTSAVLQKLEPDNLGLSLHYEDWPGQTQMLIPLKPSSLGAIPEIDLPELRKEQVVEEFLPEPETEPEIQPIVEAEAEPKPEVQPITKAPTQNNSGRITWIALLILLLLLAFSWLKHKKRRKNREKKTNSPPLYEPNRVEKVEVPAGPIPSRYFPKLEAERQELKSEIIQQRIEVPYDQYQDWLGEVVEQINKGKISTQNILGFQSSKDSEKAAAHILSRGNLSYAQAKNISQSGQIKALHFDENTGIVRTDSNFGIGCIGQFAIARWNGVKEETALRITVLQELISGNISLNSLRKKMPKSISDQDLIQSFELISWLLVDKLYKAAEFGKAAVYNAAAVLLERDIRGAAAKSYLAKILRSNSTDNLVKMPIRILPRFAAAPEETSEVWQNITLRLQTVAQRLQKQHLYDEVCNSIGAALQDLREDYAMTAAQYQKELEPVLVAQFSEALLEKFFQQDIATKDYIYSELEGFFAEALSKKEPVLLRDEQIQAELNSLEQQILQALKHE